MNDKISIILPVYNVDKYLRKCIDSILNQTYKNFELIIIDDGSTDNCPSICDEYKLLDNRIQVIHQENKGLSAARNVGIDLSIGKYITFIDSDDYIDNKYLEILHKLIVENKADMAVCDKIIVNDKEKETNKLITNYNNEIIDVEEAYMRMFKCNGIGFNVWSKLYKTNIVKKIKFPKGKLYEDIFVINKIMSSVKKIIVTNYNGYYYLKRRDSITNTNISDNHMNLIEGSIKFKDYMLRNYPNLNDYTIRGYVNANFTVYRKAVLDNNFKKEYKSIRKEILSYKKDIFANKIYPFKMKFQTFLLLFGNTPYKIFYKIYKKGC